ncbi:two-component system, OmpR family, sensor histidine kinase CreC [Cupriavidus sp. OV038]|uniref:two-component system sensor histidine kinase CreC n=1 Tax=unclassified Cupriavidus TaxID=2640874 RepID=UPI0008E3F518|nr:MULTISPECIES: two-component system sensor histidine kinase CreC [unclassified Cupriavidus]SFC85614.1 two-component system, OmpR family, sensor histidine kinase CreC [Cupriavidus sp. OV038]SFO81065.1 two-component system, OmpR family, sensor histidine kinase CreC [Cupriavidus sp. OV096]
MHIGLRIFFGFFLIVGLAAFLTLRVFVQEVKPGARQAMEDTLADTAQVLALLAADDMQQGHIGDGAFARRVATLASVPVDATIWGVHKDTIHYRVTITDSRGIVRFDSAGTAAGADHSRWNDVARTLQGKYGARSTRTDPDDEDSTVMHVAAPIRADDAGGTPHGGPIIGVLTVSKPNRVMAPFIDRSRQKILLHGLLLMGCAFVIGLACTLWLVHGLRRLQRYARAVAAGERAEMPLRGAGELAELGRAVETMRLRLEDKQYVEHYIHTLTHEMKSPLAAIGGAAELLQEEMPADDRRRFAANIQGQTRRLELMIGKLLMLAAVEQKQQLDASEPVALLPLLEAIVEACEPRARQRGVTLHRQPRPEGFGAPVVSGDPFLLHQALANLLDNALDFSPAHGTVDIAVLPGAAGMIDIRITDDGPGIPAYAQGRLFERFYSLPRPNGRDKSTGLGLCLVREVAALHHGHIAVENRPGGGAVATLSLPASGM